MSDQEEQKQQFLSMCAQWFDTILQSPFVVEICEGRLEHRLTIETKDSTPSEVRFQFSTGGVCAHAGATYARVKP